MTRINLDIINKVRESEIKMEENFNKVKDFRYKESVDREQYQEQLYEIAGGCECRAVDGCHNDTVVIGWEVYRKVWEYNSLGEQFPMLVTSREIIGRFVRQKDAIDLENEMRINQGNHLSYETFPVFAKVPKFVKVQ